MKNLGKVLVFLFWGMSLVLSTNTVRADGGTTCPEGDGWVKVEVPNGLPEDSMANPGPNIVSYTAGENQKITEICIKGGSNNSPNGYMKYFESNSWYQIDGVNCVGASGIGTNSASALRNSSISGSICAGISNASFKVESVETETPVPTDPTEEPTETETPVPTDPTEEPTETETPVPTDPTETITTTVVVTDVPAGGSLSVVNSLLIPLGGLGIVSMGGYGISVLLRRRKNAK